MKSHGKMLVSDKRDRVIPYMFCRDRHLTLMFSGPFYKKICLRKVKFGEKFFQKKFFLR